MTVVQFRSETPKSLRDRLYRPQNGRDSSELDIVSGTTARERRAALLQQEEEIKRAKADFMRQKKLDDLMRKVVENHVRNKKIAIRVFEQDAEMAPPTMKRIIKLVAASYNNITPIDILSRRRTANLSMARHIVMYLARMLTFRSLAEIGRMLQDRDHTTVMHGINKIERLIAEDAALREKIKGLEKALSEAE